MEHKATGFQVSPKLGCSTGFTVVSDFPFAGTIVAAKTYVG